MGWPKGKPRKPVGSEVRQDAEPAPVQQVWRTDHTTERPGWKRQFMRENEVHDRGRSRYVLDRRTGEHVKVGPWVVVNEEDAGLIRERPDLANPVDTVARMGPHVLMEIPEKDWELLQHEKDAVPDAQEARMISGAADIQDSPVTEDFSEGGTSVVMKQKHFKPHPALMGGFQGNGG